MFERNLLASAAASVAMSSAREFTQRLDRDPTIAHHSRNKSRVPYNGACKLGPFSSIKKHMRHARKEQAHQRALAAGL